MNRAGEQNSKKPAKTAVRIESAPWQTASNRAGHCSFAVRAGRGTVRGVSRVKLTARLLESLKPGEIARDAVVRGLFAEAGKTGLVSLKIQADLRHGARTGEARKPVSVRMTLGRFPRMTIDAARAEAMRLLAEIKAGRDPRLASVAAGMWTVEQMRDAYVEDLRIRDKSALTIRDFEAMFRRYLADWLPLPLASITKEQARDRHAQLCTKHGKSTANKALRAFRTGYRFASRVRSEPLGPNPVAGVTFAREHQKHHSIAIVDLPGWYRKVKALGNPLRAAMHELGLFSGLRPGNLVAIQRGWLRLDQNAIVFPAEVMKGRREFDLPLSGHMIAIVRRALAAGDVLHPGSPWLFPSRDRDGQHVIATKVWRERSLPDATGHALRHTYSNAARLAGVDDVDRELLLAHKIPGVQGVYLDVPTLFSRLLEQQERVTVFLLRAASAASAL